MCFRISFIRGYMLAATLIAAGAPAQASEDVAALAAKLAALEVEVGYLRDRQQIHDVILRYMRGFDRRDRELMESAFWPEAQINYPGAESQSVDDLAEVHWPAHAKTSTMHNGHLITNESVQITGDVAHMETYVTQFTSLKAGVFRTPSGKDAKSHIVSGRYIDRLERRNGEWRIAVREFFPHFFARLDSGLGYDVSWPTDNACGGGTQDKRDVSYQRPLKPRKAGQKMAVCAE